jgi:hypothetical protein
MDADSSADDADAFDLVTTLNSLLAVLNLHGIQIESPEELTPSLLLGILECILQARLPIPQDIRRARDLPAKVEAMKIFLGVLEGDVFQSDVGLADLDPRRLANGEWQETVYIGRILCELARSNGLLPDDADAAQAVIRDDSPPALPYLPLPHLRTLSPSTRSTTTNSMNTGLSMVSSQAEETITTVDVSRTREEDSMDVDTSLPPRCIHEIGHPPAFSLGVPVNESHLGNRGRGGMMDNAGATTSVCDCTTRASTSGEARHATVRYTGWIEPADEESEMHSFEASRIHKQRATPRRPDNIVPEVSVGILGHLYSSHEEHSSPSQARSSSLPSGFTPPQFSTPKKKNRERVTTKHVSPTQRRIELMNERARLLSELAKLSV